MFITEIRLRTWLGLRLLLRLLQIHPGQPFIAQRKAVWNIVSIHLQGALQVSQRGHCLQDIGATGGVIQHRQLVQRLQPQVVQKLACGGKQRRAAYGFPMPNDLHPTSILQLLHDQTIDRDTPDIFDISARHRLAVGNDGQCLQRGTGIARGLLRVKLVQVLPHFGAALESPTRSHLHQLDPSQGPVLLKLLQEDFQCVRPQRIIKKYTQLSHSHGLRSADQGGFEDPFGIHRIHGSAIPGKFGHVPIAGTTPTAGVNQERTRKKLWSEAPLGGRPPSGEHGLADRQGGL